jgi:hypothetical protein
MSMENRAAVVLSKKEEMLIVAFCSTEIYDLLFYKKKALGSNQQKELFL